MFVLCTNDKTSIITKNNELDYISPSNAEDIEDKKDPLIATIFGWAGTCFAVIFFITPLKLFIEMTKTKSFDNIPISMLILNNINTCFWIIYGLAGAGLQIWVCNVIGLVFSMIFLAWYIICYFEKTIYKIISILVSAIVIGSLLFLGIYSAINLDTFGEPKVKDVVGIIAMVIVILMFASPGQNIYFVCKTGNYNLIPILSSLLLFLNCISWVIYGFTKFEKSDVLDKNLIIPNSLGIALSLLQMVLWIYYYIKKKHKVVDDKKEKIDIEKEIKIEIIDTEEKIFKNDTS